MTRITIPYIPPDLGPNSDFQTKIFRKNREAVLSELRCLSSIPEIIRTLNPDAVYKIVCSPEGGKLYRDAAGNLKGVFYKDGRIVQHAKLQAVGPSLVKCATAVGSQILLVHVAMQLNDVKKEISKITNILDEDRLAEISSGAEQYEQATLIRDPEWQSRQIQNSIQTLNNGIERTFRTLKRQIDEALRTKSDLWESFWNSVRESSPLHSGEEEILESLGIDIYEIRKAESESRTKAKRLKPAEESFQACLIGIEILAECYAVINEPEAAISTLIKNLAKLKSCGIESAHRAVDGPQHLPIGFDSGLWRLYLERESSLLDELENGKFFIDQEFDCIEIEVKPVELLEGGR